MAKTWYIDTSADRGAILMAAHDVFLTRPTLAERGKLWSKSAQLRSMLRWEEASADGADFAAVVVSGGLREAMSSSRAGPGSMLGTTVALKIHEAGGLRQAQFWLAGYNTFMGLNQQGDVLKAFTKQVAARLASDGARATAHK